MENDYTFSDRYAHFLFPTASELAEEERWSRLSDTEKELELVRDDMLEGKIERYSENYVDNGSLCYEDTIDCILWHAVDDGKISEEEWKRLYMRFAPDWFEKFYSERR